MVTLSVFALVFLAIVEKSPPGALAYSSFKKKLTPIPFPSPLPSATDPDPPKPWTCDVSSGSWTPSANLPLYTGLTCPYIRSGHNCQTAGRSDMSYQKLRWRPWGCKVVQLTPQRLLTLFRNKTVVVFGDSVSKDLSTSLRCMLHAASPNFSRFKLAGGATRVWGEKVEPQNIRIVSLFSSHLNDIGFIPDASQPPSAAAAAAGATNWWYAEDNQWFLGGRQQKITRDAAYAIGLATLRDHVARSGFKGKAVVMGVSPSHYIVPVAGMKKGKCDINTRLDWNQTKEVRRMDSRSFEMRKVQLQVLKGSRLRYVDVLPMSFWRPDGHVVTLESTIVCTGVKLV
ncbi:unnamed protein product [Closterium sp. NIES-65]|nr:unnamed protein product [Closterium sp. NIES-65]